MTIANPEQSECIQLRHKECIDVGGGARITVTLLFVLKDAPNDRGFQILGHSACHPEISSRNAMVFP